MKVTDEMVNRFLMWKLPDDFAPDAGISFKRVYNEKSPYGPNNHEPVGTNLFDATQARAMLEHVIAAAAPVAEEPQALRLPGINGVGRDAKNDRVLCVYLKRPATDDELRAVHIALAA